MITANSIYNEIVSNVMTEFDFPVFMNKSNNVGSSLEGYDNNISSVGSFDNVLNEFMEYNVSDDELSQSITNAIHDASEKYDIDPNLIKAVIRQESNFNPSAVSSAGAQGLMQLMPLTAQSLGVTDSMDIEQNVDAGAHYLDELLEKYNGDEELALAAYNAGPSTVDKYDGIPPYEETENYVSSVLTYKQKYVAEQYGNNKNM